LLTHTFAFADAPKAYDLIVSKTEPYVGMVLKYQLDHQVQTRINFSLLPIASDKVIIGLIGAGSFGQNFLLPALKNSGVVFGGIVTARANNARNIADKNGFSFASGNVNDIFENKEINTVFIASRHDSHAAYILAAIHNQKNVFVEKPLCMNEDELHQIQAAYAKNNVHVMVGFNRRFAPFIQAIKNTIPNKVPLAINYRINAGAIPADHWIHHPSTGGGRIVGEACHFIDLCMFIAGSPIESIRATAINDAQILNDTVVLSLRFLNGSIANISYFSNGNKLIGKEYLEVFGSGIVAVVDDFKTLTIYGKNEKTVSGSQDKGHQQEVKAFVDAIKKGLPAPISFEDVYMSTLATFKALESIAGNGHKINL
jgi:polar amino acid transport system substrate-binding protein